MKYVSYGQLHKDCRAFARKLMPYRFDVVAGVPRSGMIVAAILAQELGARLACAETLARMGAFSCGLRPLPARKQTGKILVVDDSINTGKAIAQAKLWTSGMPNVSYAALYARVANRQEVDFHYRCVETPRVFEWSLWGNRRALNGAFCDIDGTLVDDPDPKLTDEQYAEFVKSTSLIRPLSVRIGTLITCRLEKYRSATEDWAKRNGVEYGRLLMMDYKSAKDRRREMKHGEWKGSHYRDDPLANLFIENVEWQANAIRRISRKPVLCLARNEVLL